VSPCLLSAGILWGVFAAISSSADPASEVDYFDLASMDIESLMNIKIVSAAKKEQRISESAAAVFVITQDDIRRSGVTTIPDALRMVPGLQVAQQDANTWAVSSRGFNSRFANKLLVMIDGRTVYTPLFSGVYWDVQGLLLEDIDRIEVIRGPGAALWGANAVNGVINIITRRAQETTGTLVTGGYGTEERGFAGFRHGDKIGRDGAYRIYFQYFNRDELKSTLGGDAADDWSQVRGGFRIDLGDGEPDAFTLQGDIYEGTSGSTVTEPTLLPPFSASRNADTDVAGGNLLGRWTRTFSDSSGIQLQLYYDRTERDSPYISSKRDTVDVDFQHRFAGGDRHEWVWGAGYRYTVDETKENSPTFVVEPERRDRQLANIFLQNEITVIKEVLRVTLGSKLEYNEYTDYEIQPSARVLWTPDKKQSIWAAISRAVRTPSRAENDFTIDGASLPPGALVPGSPPAFVRLTGNSGYDSEDLLAYELGYRVMMSEKLSVDLATFYNQYDNLRTLEARTPFPEASPSPPHLVLPVFADNKMDADTYGIEMAVDYHPLEWWRLGVAYTFLDMQLHVNSDSSDTTSEAAEGQSPQHQFSLRSSMNVFKNIEFDVWFRYVDSLPAMSVDSYTTADVRLGWRLSKNSELALVGRNLMNRQHQEFEPLVLGGVPSEVERSVYIKFTTRL